MTSFDAAAPPSKRRSFIELVASLSQQAHFALGKGGVVLAAAAGAIGLACCAISLAVVTLSLHITDAEHRRQETTDLLELDQSLRGLTNTIQMISDGRWSNTEARARLRQAAGRYGAALASACGADTQPLPVTCPSAKAIDDLIAPEAERFDPPTHTLDPVMLSRTTILVSDFNAASIAAARIADGLIQTLVDDYGTALTVLLFSTLSFAGAGVVLIFLVGRASVEYHGQWQAARHAHDMLRETIDALSAGVVVYDSEERLLMFNSVAAAVTPSLQRADSIGKTYEELERETARRLEAAGNGPQPIDDWLERFRGKQSRRVRKALDGRWFDWSERRTPSGRTVGLRVDVTEIKNHEQALERARAEYQSLIDSLSDIVFKLDIRSGDFTFASAAAADFFGQAPAQLVGKPFLDRVPQEHHARVKELARRLLRQPSAVEEAEFAMQAAQGRSRHV
jgi:PAS domain S-box-containing protein